MHCSAGSSNITFYYLKAKKVYVYLFYGHILQDISFSEKSK